MTKLHILSLNWNGITLLQDLRPSLKASLEALPGAIEPHWYVRDNGSTDGSFGYLESITDIPTRIFSINHNRDSFATGVNGLWRAAQPDSGDYILLLNNDIIFFDPSSVAKMIGLQKQTDASVVGARLLYTGTKKLQHAGVIFSHQYARLPYHYRPNENTDAAAEKNRYFQAVTAACCLVTADAFQQIGGLDERFKWAFEDIDMCLAIRKNGGKIAYCGGTGIFHGESVSLKKNPANKLFQNSNVKLFREKWTGKYDIDHDLYLKNPKHNEIVA